MNMKKTKESKKTQRPNEGGAVRVDGFVRIIDPETGDVIVETRA